MKYSPCLQGPCRLGDCSWHLLPAQAQIHSVHNARLFLLGTIWNPISPCSRVTPECLWWASRSSIIWLPSTFLGLFSALLNGPCALASLGYLLLPVWGWLYWYYVCNSLQCVFYVSTGVSEDFLQLYSSSPPGCNAWLGWLYCAPRVLLKGIEWWQTSRGILLFMCTHRQHFDSHWGPALRGTCGVLPEFTLPSCEIQ